MPLPIKSEQWTVWYLASFLAGALALSLFSSIQKIIIGADPLNPMGYVVPVCLGGLTGLALGLAFRRILKELAERREAEKRLRKSERQVRKILESINVGVLVVDAKDHKIIEANPVALNLMEAGRREDVVGRECHNFVCPAERGRCPISDLGQTLDNSDREVLTLSGRAVPVVKTVVPLEIGGRDLLLESFIDTTESKKMESQLRQAQKMEAVGTLASGIAHDFNNILSVVMGYGELALEKTRDGRPNAAEIGKILGASERAKGLIEKLMTFSRKAEAQYEPIDLDREVASAVDILRDTMPKMVRVEWKVFGPSKWVLGDAGQLQQVILNLGVNSADAMPDGGCLTFETKVVDLASERPKGKSGLFSGNGKGKYALLRVSDTGQGMDEATQSKLFEPFFTTKEVGKGTGLGLATVYGIVKGHHGHIHCESSCGLGTTFNIYIPLSPGGLQAELPLIMETETLDHDKKTVLVVDDEAAIRDINRQVLESRGYRTMLACCGEEALGLYRDRGDDIDLVVMDLGMPGMGGEACSRRLMEMDPRIRLIVASGYPQKNNLQDILDSKHRQFISKPYKVSDLLHMVCDVLKR